MSVVTRVKCRSDLTADDRVVIPEKSVGCANQLRLGLKPAQDLSVLVNVSLGVTIVTAWDAMRFTAVDESSHPGMISVDACAQARLTSA